MKKRIFILLTAALVAALCLLIASCGGGDGSKIAHMDPDGSYYFTCETEEGNYFTLRFDPKTKTVLDTEQITYEKPFLHFSGNFSTTPGGEPTEITSCPADKVYAIAESDTIGVVIDYQDTSEITLKYGDSIMQYEDFIKKTANPYSFYRRGYKSGNVKISDLDGIISGRETVNTDNFLFVTLDKPGELKAPGDYKTNYYGGSEKFPAGTYIILKYYSVVKRVKCTFDFGDGNIINVEADTFDFSGSAASKKTIEEIENRLPRYNDKGFCGWATEPGVTDPEAAYTGDAEDGATYYAIWRPARRISLVFDTTNFHTSGDTPAIPADPILNYLLFEGESAEVSYGDIPLSFWTGPGMTGERVTTVSYDSDFYTVYIVIPSGYLSAHADGSTPENVTLCLQNDIKLIPSDERAYGGEEPGGTV